MNNCIPFLDVWVIFANENKGKDMMGRRYMWQRKIPKIVSLLGNAKISIFVSR